MKLHCLVVDEKPQVARQLEELILGNSSWALAGTYVDPSKAVSFVRHHPVDLIFWDQQMPQASTVAVRASVSPATTIIFTGLQPPDGAQMGTSSRVEYLAKPITLSRFLITRDRIQHFFNIKAQGQAGPTHLEEAFIFVKTGRIIKKIFWNSVLFLEGEKEYVRLVTTSEAVLLYKRLKELEELLPLPFLRIHNSYIINAHWLDKVQEGEVYIGQQQIPIGEKFKKRFWAYVEKRML